MGDFLIRGGILIDYYGNGGDVVIPDGVTKVAPMAVLIDSTITGLTIPFAVKEIGWQSFARCTNLSHIDFGEGIKTISDSAFCECEKLKRVTIPACVEEIGEMVFGSCISMREILVDPKNERYASRDGVLFDIKKNILKKYPAANKRKEYSIPNGTKEIGGSAFYGCANLRRVVIPEGTKAVRKWAFRCCDVLEEVLMPMSLRTIEAEVFSKCKSLKGIMLPHGLRTIGEKAFDGCTGLKRVVIPGSVLRIEKAAFKNCSELEEVTIPGNPVIQGWPFSGCSKLREIKADNNLKRLFYSTLSGNSAPWASITPELFWDIYLLEPSVMYDRRNILTTVIENKNIALLHAMLEVDCIMSPQLRDELIDSVAAEGDTEVLAMLLDYKNRTADLEAERVIEQWRIDKEFAMIFDELAETDNEEQGENGND